MNNQELSSIHASPYSEIIAVIFVIIVLINIIFVIIIFIVAMSSPVSLKFYYHLLFIINVK